MSVKHFGFKTIKLSLIAIISCGICIGDREDKDCGIQPDADLAIALSPEIKYYDSQDDYICLID